MASAHKSPDGRQARWDKHNQERRRVIIDAAIAELEAADQGAEVHVQQIAERAGLSRTVVYRHFQDRSDLDAAVQGAALEMLTAELLPSLSLDGTISDIIHRIVGTYVRWTLEHQELHRFSERELVGVSGISPLQRAVVEIASQVEALILVGAKQVGADIEEHYEDALDPLVFALVGAVFGGVRRWLSRTNRRPDTDALIDLLSDSVWFLIDGHARQIGLVLDPLVQIEELFAAAFGGQEDTDD